MAEDPLYGELQEDRSYYHGKIDREEACELLMADGEDGSFLMRMSTSQDDVYTISLMQGDAVRHLRIINAPTGGYMISHDDEPVESVWDLIANIRFKILESTELDDDEIKLVTPLQAAQEAIAPDLMQHANEAMGLSAADLGDDVALFLQGGSAADMALRRKESQNHG